MTYFDYCNTVLRYHRDSRRRWCQQILYTGRRFGTDCRCKTRCLQITSPSKTIRTQNEITRIIIMLQRPGRKSNTLISQPHCHFSRLMSIQGDRRHFYSFIRKRITQLK